MIYALRLSSMILASIALIPAGAHFFSLLSKMRLTESDYLVAQRAYDGWSMFGIVVIGALLTTLALAIVLYRAGLPYLLPLASFACIAGTQLIFWVFTFPTNRLTNNWTQIPDQWEAVRRQWELSHAGSAVLNFIALLLLFLSALGSR